MYAIRSYYVVGQIGQERLYLRFAHVGRMFFMMKENVVFDPPDVAFLRPHAVMFQTDFFPDDIQKLLFHVGSNIRTLCAFQPVSARYP